MVGEPPGGDDRRGVSGDADRPGLRRVPELSPGRRGRHRDRRDRRRHRTTAPACRRSPTATSRAPPSAAAAGRSRAGIRPVALDLELDPRSGAPPARDRRRQLVVAHGGRARRRTRVRSRCGRSRSRITTGTLGVTQVALSPQIGMGGSAGIINDDIAVGGQFQFVYAITTDDTVRVADVLNAQPRVRHPGRSAADQRRHRCRPALVLAGRRADHAGAAAGSARARDRAVRRCDPDLDRGRSARPRSRTIRGCQARTSWSATSASSRPPTARPSCSTSMTTTILTSRTRARRSRSRCRSRSRTSSATTCPPAICGPGSRKTAPRSRSARPTAPIQMGRGATPAARAPPPRRPATSPGRWSRREGAPAPRRPPGRVRGRRLDARRCPSSASRPPTLVRDLAFPDLRGLRDETWALTWEGSLSADRGRPGDRWPGGPRQPDRGRRRGDADRRSVARRSAMPASSTFDVVQLRGCDPSIGDAECPLGYTCYVHPNSQVAGLGACMLDDEADRLADACKDFLISQRRYTVGRSASGELELLPRKHVLRTTPVDGCVDDAQCEVLADYALELASSSHPVDDTTAADPRTYRVRGGPGARAPRRAGPDRQALRRGVHGRRRECTTGRVCRRRLLHGGRHAPAGVRERAAALRAARRARRSPPSGRGRATSTRRSSTPRPARCVRDPNAHPFEVGRIALTPPACDPTADPRTGRLPDGTFEPNPCALTVDHHRDRAELRRPTPAPRPIRPIGPGRRVRRRRSGSATAA